MDREWRLGIDLNTADNLLDGLTFDDLILAVQCNCREITPEAVAKELRDMLASRMQDMEFLVKNNLPYIIGEARRGRS